jgi:hypothetical protein
MIFSFSDVESEFVFPEQNKFDVLCLYKPNISSISSPKNSWFQVACASLRIKRDVLILEPGLKQWPAIKEHQRWQLGEGWVAIEPRALNAILDAYPNHCTNIEQFRLFLSSI